MSGRGTDSPAPEFAGRKFRGGDRLLKYSLVAPVLIFLIALNIYPLFHNIVLGFSNAKLTGGGFDFVGGANYGRIFSFPDYGAALRTTATFVVAAVGIELLLGFCLALALREQGRQIARPRWKAVVLTVLLVPMMLSPAVMGLYWNLVLNGHYGVLNQFLAFLHLPEPQWLTSPGLKLITILLIDIWMWTPFMMLISLSALNSIPRYIYEAAEIDRAGRWTVFRRITLPMCAPLLLLAVLLRTTDALKQFDLVMAITGPNDSATQTVSALLYMDSFRYFKVGLGSAYACVILVVVIGLASVFTRYLGYVQAKQGRAGP